MKISTVDSQNFNGKLFTGNIETDFINKEKIKDLKVLAELMKKQPYDLYVVKNKPFGNYFIKVVHENGDEAVLNNIVYSQFEEPTDFIRKLINFINVGRKS